MSTADKFYETSEKILELCIHAKTPWDTLNFEKILKCNDP